MTEIFHFESANELSASENLKNFIRKCKFELTIFGDDLDWDAWKWRGVCQLTQLGTSSGGAKAENALHPDIIEFAKAYCRYQQGHNSTKHVREIVAIRVIEKALLQVTSKADISDVSITVLDEALNIAKEHYKGSYHQAGKTLEKLAQFVSENKLVPNDVRDWKTLTSRKPDRNKIGTQARIEREKKLPDDEAVDALAEIFFNNSGNPRDIFTTSTFAMLMCASSRISEVLLLPVECEIEEPDKKGVMRYGWRFYSAKGYGANIKWIPTVMVDVAKEAVKRIKLLTDPSRKLAKWIEEHPNKFYRPPNCPDVSDDEPLTAAQACLALGLHLEIGMSPLTVIHSRGFEFKKITLR